MKITKVRFAEYGNSLKPIAFEINTSRLTADECAELRFLIDLSQILTRRTSHAMPVTEQPGVFIIVETGYSMHAAHFVGEIPPEVAELANYLKTLRQAHCRPARRSA